MTDVETKRKFIEELRGRLLAEESELLLECLDRELGYGFYQTDGMQELRLESSRTPERLARWEEEQKEFVERLKLHEELEGPWCAPFIQRLPPPRREDLDVDDVTDLVKYVYANLAKAIAELQYQLAELAGTGKLDPDANHDLQWNWCHSTWEFLYHNTTARIRREHDTCDWDWDRFDNTYANALQVMSRVDVEPVETDDHWEFNEHLCGDGPIQEYPRNGAYHISELPFYGGRRKSSDV
jgi:hypothetical protein